MGIITVDAAQAARPRRDRIYPGPGPAGAAGARGEPPRTSCRGPRPPSWPASRRDGPATTADLARAEGVKPQSMGTTIAALEEMGTGRADAASDRRPPGAHRADRQGRGRAEEPRATPSGRGWRRRSPSSTKQDQETLFAAGRNHQAPGGAVNAGSRSRTPGARCGTATSSCSSSARASPSSAPG